MFNRLRFAPSPTGLLHVGNIRVALINWLFARKTGGEFYLRLDDTDSTRSKEEYSSKIKEDLSWLNLDYDKIFNQKSRLIFYEDAKNILIKKGLIYPCFETHEELEVKRKLQLMKGDPPKYTRDSLYLSENKKRDYLKEGRRVYWRFYLKEELVKWYDLIFKSELSYDTRHLSDPIVVREDGTFLYTFSSVVDDIYFKISHIIRGEDHISNTAIQIQIYRELNDNQLEEELQIPKFGHLSLLTESGGKSLSKRDGRKTSSITYLREYGIDPMTINSYLARLGTSTPITPCHRLESLIEEFDLSKFSKSSPCFSINEIKTLNKKSLQTLPYSIIKTRLNNLGSKWIDEEFWNVIKNNINFINDALFWENICFNDIDILLPDDEFLNDINYLSVALENLPQDPWNENTWELWTNNLSLITKRTGKNLFMPLRIAITGVNFGPEMKMMLLYIGSFFTKKRISKILTKI